MQEAQSEKTRALIEYRLRELERKQDKHNSVIERTYKVETEVKNLKDREKDLEARLNSLEN